MELYNKEKVLEIYKNLQHTYDTMKDSKVMVPSNPMFKPSRASKASIKRKLPPLI